jgi:hypothetical protein
MAESNNRLADKSDRQLLQSLFESAGVDERWQAVVESPEACEKITNELKALAAMPIVRAEQDEVTSFIYKSHIINLRALVWPVLVASVVHVAVTVAPAMDSALLPWLDVAALLEKVRTIYRHLNDDEVDVFGAISALYTMSERSLSVVDPNLHPTARGVRNWFTREGYESPPDTDGILKSLVEKGALIKSGDLYTPSFLGASRE